MRKIVQICVALSKKLNFTGKNTIASNVSQFCTQLLIKKLKPGKMVAAKKHRKYFNTPILLKVPSLARAAAAEKVWADSKADLQKATENDENGDPYLYG